MDLTSMWAKKPSQVNIYQYDAQLAMAFQSDCENFLQKFQQHQNFSFTTFANLWKDECFLSIFKDQQYILMFQAFLENCFFIIKKFLFSSDPYIQAGAIYLLYGLYYKQPVKDWVKIRLTQTEFDKLCEIYEIHRANKSLDVVFIYNKMRIDEVFQYCALVQPLGLEPRFMRRYDLSNGDINVKTPYDNCLKKFKNLVEEDEDFAEFQKTNDEYQKLAQKYMEKCGKLFIFPSNELNQIYDELCNNDLSQSGGDEDRLKEVKHRAMNTTNATYRGDRKVLTAQDLDTPSTSKKIY
ncbi:snRNA-activating protein complex subunit 1-like [Tribolium madens]|uniref:snRNA-activating protein complex subunit 1-like n=1 Tax=Tribolium madens TaxID=41895 RepID=UPI001CF74BEB|nr:snRNA-activating protein complex subunit 1-like [Tribolium madens]XP_044261470.1 snRNA-activating protein complex subunit 1-like [Tribolium madens]XP_044261471.1 snRNA-activating protein complex subunit 1-like [Tribolium madens]